MQSEGYAFLSGVIVTAIVFAIVLGATDRVQVSRIKREAVKVGAAIYVADEDGDPVFTWVKAAKED